MRPLIADLLWRNRWKAAHFLVTLMVIVGLSAALGDPAPVFWMSMGFAFGLGPLTLWHVPRSIWYLPIAKRDIWRAGWLVATVGVALLTTTVKLVALLVPQVRASFGFGSAVLSSVYDFAYAGVGCGLVILATRPQPNGTWRRVSAISKGLGDFTLPLGMSAAMMGYFAVGNILPTHWTDLTARSVAVLIAALGVTIATFFHTPTPLTPANRIQRKPRVAAASPRVDPGGLSGLPRLLFHESAWTLMTGGSMVVGSGLFVFVAARFAQSPEGVVGFLRSVLLRLDGRVTPAPGGGFDAFILLIAFAVFAASLAARFPAMLRHLRVLPLGAARLNALLIAWPAVIWLTAWTGLLALHYAILGHGVVFYHADALLGLIGVSAIVQAMTLRLSGFVRFLAFAPLLVIVPSLLFLDVPPPAAFVAVGVGGLAAAAVLNQRSLARRSTYTLVGPALGGVQMF